MGRKKDRSATLAVGFRENDVDKLVYSIFSLPADQSALKRRVTFGLAVYHQISSANA
jgi:hypothetical protein